MTHSKCLVFRHRKEDSVRNLLLNTVDEYVYLGHQLKFNLDDSDDVKCKLNKFYSSFYMTVKIFLNFVINALLQYI